MFGWLVYFWGLSSHSRIFHSYGDVTIAGEGCKFLSRLGTHGNWADRVLKCATLTVTSICNGHLRGHVTLAPIAERLAVTTCFYDLGLSRLGFERPPYVCEAHAPTHCVTAAFESNTEIIYSLLISIASLCFLLGFKYVWP